MREWRRRTSLSPRRPIASSRRPSDSTSTALVNIVSDGGCLLPPAMVLDAAIVAFENICACARRHAARGRAEGNDQVWGALLACDRHKYRRYSSQYLLEGRRGSALRRPLDDDRVSVLFAIVAITVVRCLVCLKTRERCRSARRMARDNKLSHDETATPMRSWIWTAVDRGIQWSALPDDAELAISARRQARRHRTFFDLPGAVRSPSPRRSWLSVASRAPPTMKGKEPALRITT